MDSLELGPTPYDESCQQVGAASYDRAQAREECARYIRTLRHIFGNEPDGARFRVTSNPHDFGTYFEVAVSYDDSIPEAVAYAFRVESNLPSKWIEGVL